jgi:carboxyl-terminal processing protease
MTALHLGVLVVCLAAAPDESPRVAQLVPPAPSDPDAEEFARRLQEIHDVIAKDSLVRPSPRRLAELALRGLYNGQGEDFPDDLAARLKNDKAPAAELGAVLHDGYRQLAARCELDVNLAVNESVSFALRALDPHGRVRPHVIECFLRDPHRVGIGVDLRLDPNPLEPRVVTPLLDGPAYDAGLRAGDVITHVHLHKEPGPNNQAGATEATPTAGERLDRVYAWLAGDNGSKVVLTVRRVGGEAPLLVGVVRGPAVRETVLGFRRKKDDSWDYFADAERKVGYVSLTAFARDTDKLLREILAALEKQGARGVVIDLRDCPGGLISGAEAMTSRFLDSGVLFRIRPSRGDDYVATGFAGKPRCTLPVVCLVNEGTASMAEVFAAALQDHRRAAVVGERTYGKGSLQYVQNIDGSELTLTTAVFLRPSGKKLDRIALPGHGTDEWGVTPDAGNVVRLSPAEKDALKEHLERRAIIPRRDVPMKEPAFKDRQLQRALEVLARDRKTK